MSNRRESVAPVLPQDIEEALTAAIAAIEPPSGRKNAVRSLVLDRVRRERERFVTVRSADGDWVPLLPSIAFKMLHDDGAMQSFLLKLGAGATLPAHEHRGDEISIVLEGSCRIGDVSVGPGDYHFAHAGTRHGDLVSDGGCVLFIRAVSGTIPRGARR